jgi:hypothetical protein
MWDARPGLTPKEGNGLGDFHRRLSRCNGLGAFLAAQIVADAKYHGALMDAHDWWTWSAAGPGSTRGLNRLYGLPLGHTWTEDEWRDHMFALQSAIDEMVKAAGMPRLHAQDIQNCLCEFDKYERVRLGEGKPRALYPGAPLIEKAADCGLQQLSMI